MLKGNIMVNNIKFVTTGNTISVLEFNNDTTSSSLKNQIYQVSFNQQRGFYLTIFNDRFDNGRLFGDVKIKADKIINTYKSRDKSTGVLLTGNKGSGKSLLTKVIANKLLDEGFPILIINAPYSGPEFDKFLSLIGDCVLIFDEFAKIYGQTDEDESNNNSNQKSLLSLFDGMSNTKRLILLTENSIYHIDEHLLDRPGRIFYHFKYDKLSAEFIIEFCKFKKLEDNIINDIINYSKNSEEFSFDVLTAIIEEYLRYRLPLDDIIVDLNISDTPKEYVVIIYDCMILTTKDPIEPATTIQTIPNINNFSISLKKSKLDLDDLKTKLTNEYTTDDGCLQQDLVNNRLNKLAVYDHWFYSEDLVYNHENKYVFETNGIRLVCEIKAKKYDFAYDDLFPVNRF